jgi:hypothetical protein
MKVQKQLYKSLYCDLDSDRLFNSIDKNRGLAKKPVTYCLGFRILGILNLVHRWDERA